MVVEAYLPPRRPHLQLFRPPRCVWIIIVNSRLRPSPIPLLPSYLQRRRRAGPSWGHKRQSLLLFPSPHMPRGSSRYTLPRLADWSLLLSEPLRCPRVSASIASFSPLTMTLDFLCSYDRILLVCPYKYLFVILPHPHPRRIESPIVGTAHIERLFDRDTAFVCCMDFIGHRPR